MSHSLQLGIALYSTYLHRSPTVSILMDPYFPSPSTPLSLCEWVRGLGVLLTSLSTDLQGIRSPSDLPVRTATLHIPTTNAGHVNSQVNQKATIPKETYRNIESVGPCVSDSLQLGITLSVVPAVSPLNHY